MHLLEKIINRRVFLVLFRDYATVIVYQDNLWEHFCASEAGGTCMVTL